MWPRQHTLQGLHSKLLHRGVCWLIMVGKPHCVDRSCGRPGEAFLARRQLKGPRGTDLIGGVFICDILY